MKKYKLSPWHDGSVKPVHVGVYEVRAYGLRGEQYFSWWDGKKFKGGWISIERATQYKDYGFNEPFIKWRGILKD